MDYQFQCYEFQIKILRIELAHTHYYHLPLALRVSLQQTTSVLNGQIHASSK